MKLTFFCVRFTAGINEYTIKAISKTLHFGNLKLSNTWRMSYDPVRCAIFGNLEH